MLSDDDCPIGHNQRSHWARVMAFTSWLRKARDGDGTNGEMPAISVKGCEGSQPGLRKVTDWYTKQKAGIKEAPASQIHRALRTFQMP